MDGPRTATEPPGFSTRLRDLRLQRGLRQKDLAQALRVAQTTIANYEQNTRFPDEETLRRIARYFEVSFDELLGGARTGQAGAARAPALGELARRYLERLRAGDESGAQELLRRRLEAEVDPRTMYLEVVEPCLYEVGRLWELGEIDVADEHRITAVVDRLMTELRAAPGSSAPRNGRRFAAITVHGDAHLLGARMVSDFLEMAGWRSTYLGGNLSIRHALQALEAAPPDLLVLSATVPQASSSAADLIHAIRHRETLRDVRLLVGGQLFHRNPSLWREMGADATAVGAVEAVEAAERLVPATDRGRIGSPS